MCGPWLVGSLLGRAIGTVRCGCGLWACGWAWVGGPWRALYSPCSLLRCDEMYTIPVGAIIGGTARHTHAHRTDAAQSPS